MVGQLVVAQFDLETAIAELTRSGGSAALAQTQFQNITQLRQQVGTAGPGALAALRSEINAAVAQSQAVVQEARTAASGASASDGATVAGLASHAQAQASSFMRDTRQYDHLLRFDLEQEQEAYRQREEDRRKRYEAEAAKGTPEGALNASGAALGQMADLAAHGGSADPALMRRMDELAVSTAALRAQIIRDGYDVSKFDEGLRTDLGAIMRSKGQSDAEIDALLAEHQGNPIDAIKAFVAEQNGSISEKEIGDLSRKAREYKDSIDMAQPTTSAAIATVAPASPMVDAMAKLKASGVSVSDNMPPEPVHGITGQVASISTPSRAI